MVVLFDFGRLFAGIFAAKGIILLGYDVANALAVAAVVPILIGEIGARHRT